MNYNRIYNEIISNANSLNRIKNNGIYYEKHHIMPKCIGGSNNKENLILLTPREHFICHWLLCKIYPHNHKIIYAFNSFSFKTNGAKNHKGVLDNYNTSKNYEYARKRISNILRGKKISEKHKESLRDTTYINNSIVNKRVKKIELDTYLSKGWIKGRKKYKRTPPSEETKNKIRESTIGRIYSEETRKKVIAHSIENPRCWVSNKNSSKHIEIKDLDKYIDKGWVKGRYANSKIDFNNMTFIKMDEYYKCVKNIEVDEWLNCGWQKVEFTEYALNHKNNERKNIWMNNSIQQIRVHKTEIDYFKRIGFILGRIVDK